MVPKNDFHEPKVAGNTIYNTIQVAMETMFFFIKQINRIHHGCPVEIGKSQPEGPPVPVENEARRVSHWNGGPEGWDFPFSTGHP